MRKLFSLLIVAALLATQAFVFTSCKPSTPEPQNSSAREAVVDDYEGTVTAISDGQTTSAFKGLALLRKDLLETGADSWTSLEFNEGQFVLVEENSSIEISELADDLKNTEISLTSGKIWVVISNKLSGDESFEIKTPSCALSVRGTVFNISSDEDGGGRISVYEGTVSLKAGNESYGVTNGSAEIVAENGEVKEVRTSGLDADAVAPFLIGGPGGPGGVFGILREMLPGLTWDAGNPTEGNQPGTEVTDNPENTSEGENGQSSTQPESSGTPSPSPSPSPSPTPSPTPTTTPTTTPSPSPTPSASPSPTPTQSPSPTPTTTPTQPPSPTPTTTTTQPPSPTPTTTTTTTPTTTPTPPAVAPTVRVDASTYRFGEGEGGSVPLRLTGTHPITFDVQGRNAAGASYPYFGVDYNSNTENSSVAIPAWLPADTYYVTVTGSNSAGRSSLTFTVIIESALNPPVIQPGNHYFYFEAEYGGENLTETITATGTAPISWSLQASSKMPIPGFVGIHGVTGVLYITPSGAAGTYYFVIRAENSDGVDMRECELRIVESRTPPRTPPVFAWENHGYEFHVDAIRRDPAYFSINATGSEPITYSLESLEGPAYGIIGLPPEITINSYTGTLTIGIGIKPGSYYFLVRASNDVGSATQQCTVVVVSDQ